MFLKELVIVGELCCQGANHSRRTMSLEELVIVGELCFFKELVIVGEIYF